jgi:hypothetical protein
MVKTSMVQVGHYDVTLTGLPTKIQFEDNYAFYQYKVFIVLFSKNKYTSKNENIYL